MCRVGVWFGFVRFALVLAVGTCIVLSFEAMPGLCCFLRVTPCESRRGLQYGPATYAPQCSVQVMHAFRIRRMKRCLLGHRYAGLSPCPMKHTAGLAPQRLHFSMSLQSSRPRLEQSPKTSSWRMRCAAFPWRYAAASHDRCSRRRRCERT